MKPLLIVVSGPPSSGKSTLAQRISGENNLPLISKDAIKESLFDTLGTQDRAWKTKLSEASSQIMFQTAESILQAGQSAVIENNFQPRYPYAEWFRRVQENYDMNLLHVHCTADTEVLLSRFRQRAGSEGRHPGHMDGNGEHMLRKQLADGDFEDLAIEGKVINIDTSDLNAIPYDKVNAEIQKGLGKELATSIPEGGYRSTPEMN